MTDGPDETDAPADRPAAPPGQNQTRPAGADSTSGWYAIAGTGIEFVTAVGLFLVIGWWLDRKWNSFPWLTIVGAAVGFVVGLYVLIRAARSAFRD